MISVESLSLSNMKTTLNEFRNAVAEKMFPQTNINTVEQHKIQQPKDFLELTKYDN